MEGVGSAVGAGGIAGLLPLAAMCGNLGLAGFFGLQYGRQPEALSLAGFFALLAVWNLSLAIEGIGGHGGTADGWVEWTRLSLLVLPAAALHAAARLADVRGSEGRAIVVVGWVGALAFVVLDGFGLVLRDVGVHPGVSRAASGPAFPGFAAFVLGAAFTGALFHLRRLRSSEDPLWQSRARYWLAGTLMLVPASFLDLLVDDGFLLAPLSSSANLLLIGMCVWGALRRSQEVMGFLDSAVHRRAESPRSKLYGGLESWLARSLVEAEATRLESLLKCIVEAFGAVGVAFDLDEGGACRGERVSAGGVPDSACSGSERPWVPLSLRNGRLLVGPRPGGGTFSREEWTLLRLLAMQLDAVVDAMRQAKRIQRQENEIRRLQQRVTAEELPLVRDTRGDGIDGIVGSSAALQQMLDLVVQAAPTEVPVLICGETGTGKELVARAVHRLSGRRDSPFVAVNCPAIPVELAESELFGHERGAFTGASEARAGKFEAAQGGTVFLDEVADLPMNVQTKLLRVLQEREVQRLGSHRIIKLDIRIVAATNRDLRAEVACGRFREDLMYRLSGLEVRVPALSERVEDIPALTMHFLQRAAATYGREALPISQEAIGILSRHSWPGNVRELQNVVERAFLMCQAGMITGGHLGVLSGNAAVGVASVGEGPLRAVLHGEKIRQVEAAIVQADGNQAAAARILGMSRSNLSRLLKRYAIDVRKVMLRGLTSGAVAPATSNRYQEPSIDG